jgi:hypothetical protein
MANLDRATLETMKLEALRTLARERGIPDAGALGRGQLVERLCEPEREEPSLLDRAKEAVVEALDKVEEKAHALADRLRGEAPSAADENEGRAEAEALRALDESAPSLDVPSSTVRPPMNAPEVREPLGSGEPFGMLDLEEPPETYGLDECEILSKDPFWAFVYWEVTDGGFKAARAQLGEGTASANAARLVLRLFTTVAGPSGVERQVEDVDLPWNHGRRYVRASKPGAHLRVAVGLLSPEGYFAPIAHSSLLRVPAAEPAPEGPVEWMEVRPGRSRGREHEPLMIVRHGAGDGERGLAGSFTPPPPAGTSPSGPSRFGPGSGSGSGFGGGR